MFAAPRGGHVSHGGALLAAIETETKRGIRMSILDKITGRTKKAAGDLADDPSLRRQGSREEAKGEAKDKLDDAQDRPPRRPRRSRTSSARPDADSSPVDSRLGHVPPRTRAAASPFRLRITSTVPAKSSSHADHPREP